MAEETTETTVPEAEVTEDSGEQPTEQEVEDQKVLAARLTELETQLEQYKNLPNQLQELETAKKQLEEDKKKSDSEVLRWQATYKGLQGSTTQKLQELAQFQKRERENQAIVQKLNGLEQMINVLAESQLDETQAKALKLQMREAQLRAQEEAMANANNQAQNQATNNIYDPDQVRQMKDQYLKGYFPGFDVNPDDPRIDWGEGTTNAAEAVARFTSSVSRLLNEGKQQAPAPEPVQAPPTASIEELVQKQFETFQEQMKAQQEDFNKQREAQFAEAREAARKEYEDKARKNGIDTTSAPPPENQRSANIALRELDDGLLSTAKGRVEYNRRLEELKNKVRQ